MHEYLGTLTYRTDGQPKVVQFWRMQAEDSASFDVKKDDHCRRLSYLLEKPFLRQVSRRVMALRDYPERREKR